MYDIWGQATGDIYISNDSHNLCIIDNNYLLNNVSLG
jgi:hypothetical protein